MALTARQEAFCRAYANTPNGAAAAREAGYAETNAASQAVRLLNKPEVAARIAELNADLATLRASLDAEREAAARALSDKLDPVYKANLKDGDYDGVLQVIELQGRMRRLLSGGSTIRPRGPRPAPAPEPAKKHVKGWFEERLDEHQRTLEALRRIVVRFDDAIDPSGEQDLLREFDRRGRYDPRWYCRGDMEVDNDGYLDEECYLGPDLEEPEPAAAANANESQ